MGVQDAIAECSQVRVSALRAKIQRALKIPCGNARVTFIEQIETRSFVEIPPPQRAFCHDRESGHQAEQNRPHDRAALQEEIENDITENRCHKWISS